MPQERQIEKRQPFGPRMKATQTPEAARANIMSCAKKHTHTHNHTHQQNSHKSLHTVRKPLDCKVFGQKCGQLGQQTFAATISVILERFFRKERRRCEAFGSCVSSAPSCKIAKSKTQEPQMEFASCSLTTCGTHTHKSRGHSHRARSRGTSPARSIGRKSCFLSCSVRGWLACAEHYAARASS